MASIKVAFPKNIADEVFDKINGSCAYCGAILTRNNYGKCDRLPPSGAWEADHWLPKSVGGTDDVLNLWPACCECNDHKGTDDEELYILRRALFENKQINKVVVKRIIDAGPGRAKTGPTSPD